MLPWGHPLASPFSPAKTAPLAWLSQCQDLGFTSFFEGLMEQVGGQSGYEQPKGATEWKGIT